MLLDLLLGMPLLIFLLLGLRDGVVRKLVACIMIVAGLFLGQLYMHDVGKFMQNNNWIESPNAPMYGFLIIFLSIIIVQTLLYKILTKGYKIGGIADRVGGTILGLIEGGLFLSSLLFIFALVGIPERETVRDSRFYKTVVNIAPQILDFTSTLGPDAIEKLKEVGNPGEIKEGDSRKSHIRSMDSSAVLNKKKQNEMLNQARETGGK